MREEITDLAEEVPAELGRPEPPELLRVSAWILAGSTLFLPIFTWFQTFRQIGSVLERMGGTWTDVIPYDQPAFRDELRSSIDLYLSKPWLPFRWLFGEEVGLVLCLMLAGVCVYWGFAARHRTVRAMRWLPVAAPLFFGLAVYPLGIPGRFKLLAEAGLSSPKVIGASLGELTYVVFVGLVGTLISIGLAFWLSRRDGLAAGGE